VDRIKINWPLTPPKNDTAAEKEKERKSVGVVRIWCQKSGCVLKREMGVSVYRSKRESVCVKSRDRDSYRQNVCVWKIQREGYYSRNRYRYRENL